MIDTAYAVATSTVAAIAEPSTWSHINAILDKAMGIMDSAIMGKIVIWGLGLLGIGKYLKNRAVQRYADLAFHTVEEMARTNPETTKLDKVAAFAEVFERYMKRAGWWMLTDADMKQAEAIAKSINVLYSKGKDYVEDKAPAAPDVPAKP